MKKNKELLDKEEIENSSFLDDLIEQFVSEKYESMDRSSFRKLAKVNTAYLKTDDYNKKYDVLFENENPVVIRSEAKSIINEHKGEITEGYSIIEKTVMYLEEVNLESLEKV